MTYAYQYSRYEYESCILFVDNGGTITYVGISDDEKYIIVNAQCPYYSSNIMVPFNNEILLRYIFK